MPDHLAIRGVEKWDSKAAEVERARLQTLRITFCLSEDILWSQREFLRFNDSGNAAVRAQCVVRRTIFGRIFFDSTCVVGGQRLCHIKFSLGDNFPPGLREAMVDELLPSQSF